MRLTELLFRHCLPHSLLTLIILFALRRSSRQSSRTAYWICIILLLGLLIPIQIQLPVSPVVTEPIKTLPFAEIWIESSDAPVSSVAASSFSLSSPRLNVNGNQIITLLWLGGAAAALAIYLIGNHQSLKMIQRWSKPAEASSMELLRQLQIKLKLKRKLRLVVCRHTATPCAMGLIRPTIILPDQKWEPEELSLILTHELIHIRQNDCWVRLLCLITRVIYWFNPVVYLLEMHLNQYCEQACDEAVIKNCSLEERHQYGSLLIKQARGKGQLPLLSTGFGLKPKQIQERLTLIMNQNYFKLNWEKVLIAAALVMMTGCVIKEKEIRNFLAAPLANARAENQMIYVNVNTLKGYQKQSEFEEMFISENKNLTLNQFREKMKKQVEVIRAEGFALDSLMAYPNMIQQIVLPQVSTISSKIWDSNINQNRIITIAYILDGDNDRITFEQCSQLHSIFNEEINNYFNELSDEQLQAFLYKNDREASLSFIKQLFAELTEDTLFSVRQISIDAVRIDENQPAIDISLDLTWEELQTKSYKEIMELIKIEEGPSYILTTADGFKIYGFGIGFYQPISSICKNDEARIAAQAYYKFYDQEENTQQLQQVSDLIEKVDRIINNRLNNLEREDHALLAENLRQLILKELKLDGGMIWVDVIKY
ncbi:M56 family metallopeptidase [Holdemania massiliensis]|uniref:M56 family metallopeptidase n=1 Tax=Holdemania massiliensis TaxID=1468449 RepID=UPI001F052B77|nr:M56 family metallopeptidase [Holdemania massiliensis]MCH1941687.1 M56 family metallopeptidase [Holdemania massiliensis]